MLTEEQTWPPILSLVVVYGRIEGEVASGKVHSPCRRMRMMAREGGFETLALFKATTMSNFERIMSHA